ncbi:hypothetical protein [Erwinia sp. 9145]|uniref:hypothetical protein n=1 Tax=Erwinia sp. 9145 TaxID=1500895 RepID=UPI0005529422|nr:hypothetical protein [Erwinia sp. 9145]
MLIKKLGLFLMCTSILLFIISFFSYILNRKKYKKLIELFEQQHPLPSPFFFHASVGFLGAYPMVKFFLRIHKRGKICMIPSESKFYDFFDTESDKLTNWMRFFYKISFLSMLCFFSAILLAVVIKISDIQ